jgi:hypothetical protein
MCTSALAFLAPIVCCSTLKGSLSLEIIPAEYTLTDSSGSALKTYEAAAGYTFGK